MDDNKIMPDISLSSLRRTRARTEIKEIHSHSWRLDLPKAGFLHFFCWPISQEGFFLPSFVFFCCIFKSCNVFCEWMKLFWNWEALIGDLCPGREQNFLSHKLRLSFVLCSPARSCFDCFESPHDFGFIPFFANVLTQFSKWLVQSFEQSNVIQGCCINWQNMHHARIFLSVEGSNNCITFSISCSSQLALHKLFNQLGANFVPVCGTVFFPPRLDKMHFCNQLVLVDSIIVNRLVRGALALNFLQFCNKPSKNFSHNFNTWRN